MQALGMAKKYKFSSYQIMILETAGKKGNYIIPSIYYDHQIIVNAKGEHIKYFRRPTFDILFNTGCIKRVGQCRYEVTKEIKKLLSL